MKAIATLFTGAITIAAALGSPNASAAHLPVGVLNDVSYSTVVNTWGWKLISRSNYGGSLSIADLFNGHGKYVMIGAMHFGSETIDVLAGTLYTDVTTVTGFDIGDNAITNPSNGAEWYFNGRSMGFAGLHDMVCLYSADICGPRQRDRLSWHTSLGYPPDVPTFVYYGWRSGDNLNIYGGTDWTRVVFSADGVPEPSSLALLCLALSGLALSQRRVLLRR